MRWPSSACRYAATSAIGVRDASASRRSAISAVMGTISDSVVRRGDFQEVYREQHPRQHQLFRVIALADQHGGKHKHEDAADQDRPRRAQMAEAAARVPLGGEPDDSPK